MLILSRKPNESVVLGISSFTTMAGGGPNPPTRGGAGQSGDGGASPATCAASAANRGHPHPKPPGEREDDAQLDTGCVLGRIGSPDGSHRGQST